MPRMFNKSCPGAGSARSWRPDGPAWGDLEGQKRLGGWVASSFPLLRSENTRDHFLLPSCAASPAERRAWQAVPWLLQLVMSRYNRETSLSPEEGKMSRRKSAKPYWEMTTKELAEAT